MLCGSLDGRGVLGRMLVTQLSFLGDSDSKESACNEGDPGSIPGSGRTLRGGNDNLLQCSCLENLKDGGARGLPSMGSHRVGHD